MVEEVEIEVGVDDKMGFPTHEKGNMKRIVK